MAYVSSFVYCDKIQQIVTPNGVEQQVVRPLRNLTPINLPSNYTFSIACTIVGFQIENTNTLQLKFFSPSNEVVSDTDIISLEFPQEESSKTNSMQFNLDLQNVVLKESGTYRTEIYFNQDIIGTYQIDVSVVK